MNSSFWDTDLKNVVGFLNYVAFEIYIQKEKSSHLIVLLFLVNQSHKKKINILRNY